MMNIVAAILVLGILGAVFGAVLSVASKIFEVKKDPREEEILSHLAGANCGGCGYPGCGGCAAAILAGDAPVTACAPAGAENAAAIAKIMGQEAPSGERQVAFVRCNGGVNAKKRFDYIGVKDCISATKVAAGPLECSFGCLGFGSCGSAGSAGHLPQPGQGQGRHERLQQLLHRLRPVPAGVQEGRYPRGERRGRHRLRQVRGLQALHKGRPRDAILPAATAEEKEKYKAIKKAQAEKARAAAEAAKGE